MAARFIMILCLVIFGAQEIYSAVPRHLNKKPDEEEPDKQEIIVGPQVCMQFLGPSSSFTANPRVLKFYNGCQTDQFVKVCVQGKDGQVRMHRSGARVPGFTTFFLTLDRWEDPDKIDWTSATGFPPTPKLCDFQAKQQK